LRQRRWHGKQPFDPELRLHTPTAKVKQDKIPTRSMSTVDRPLHTLGHSNHPSAHFLALLARHGVEVVADVRSRPYSRFAPQYRKQTLAGILADAGIGYLFLGEGLGGKPPRGEAAAPLAYAARIEEPAFQDGIAQLLAAMRQARVALLCRERDPIECHRLHLICRYLAPQRLDIRHILPDGAIEPQDETERRLLAQADTPLLATADEPDALQREYDRWWQQSR
jgi:uncharacterized protein (DUF488 family)